MTATLLLCSAILGQAAGPASDRGADLAAYQAAKAEAGRTADDQIRLALWCEAHGLAAERLKHLSRATLLDPANPTARGLLGQVSYGGKWVRPDRVRAAIEDDPEIKAAMDEYNHRRARAANTADAQQRLAQWCDQHGLKDQATAHYRAVLRIDPGRDGVWEKLGYRKHDGRWSRPEDRAAEKAEVEAQKRADKTWRPLLEKYRDGLSSRDDAKRRDAEAALEAIADPRAVPMVWAVFVRDKAPLQQRAARVLAQLDGPSASQALAMLAVYSEFPEVRGRAAEFLGRRDPNDYLDLLIGLIHKPFNYRVVPVGQAGAEGGVFVEGERYDVQRNYRANSVGLSSMPWSFFVKATPFSGGFGEALIADAYRNGAQSQALRMITQAGGPSGPVAALRSEVVIAATLGEQDRRTRQEAQWRERQDVARIEDMNQEIRVTNERVLPLVKSVTGQDFGHDQDAWRGWWSDQLGYAFRSSTPKVKPTYSEVLTYNPTQPDRSPNSPYDPLTNFMMGAFAMNSHANTHSCFAAGTPVVTMTGPKPIESLMVGDRVLSQDPDTGALSYQPVLLVHHNPPAPLLKLSMGSESVVATGIHRFWKVGKGWTMARDLKPGDVLRTLGGSTVLKSTEPAGAAPVFNLDVAENRDYFVGEQGMLVYDFSVVQPVARPFDAAAPR